MNTRKDIGETLVTATCTQTVVCNEPPGAEMSGDRLYVWPIQKGVGPLFAMTVSRWREIVAAAEKAITDSQDYAACSGAVANVGGDR